jgi:hypothetical protein
VIHALVLAVLVASAAERPALARPKTPVHRPAPKPLPPPPPPAEPEAPEEADEPDEAVVPDDAPPTNTLPDDDDPFKSSRDGELPFSEQQLEAIGAASLCCCFIFGVGLVAFIVWLVRRATQPAATPAAAGAPPPAAAAAPPIPFHLSVLAVGMHGTARPLVAQQLILAGVQADPVSAADRAQLVRELTKALRGLESEWTHFGYGERLDLADEAAAQRSYQLAVDDFTRRSGDPSISGESAYVVLTLVLCTRRQLRGVSALDDRAQIRVLLDERATLEEAELMGAYIVWSAPLGGPEVLTRFPEMHAVR